MLPSGNRTNSFKDNQASFVMSDMVPQHQKNNRFVSAWNDFEGKIKAFIKKNPSKELYVIAGGYGSDNTSYPIEPDSSTTTRPELLTQQGIIIPRWTWKTVLVLNEHGLRSDDIQSDDQTYAILTRNKNQPTSAEFSAGVTHPFIEENLGINPARPGDAVITSKEQWNDWRTWQLTVEQLEQLPGLELNFFSNIPQQTQKGIEETLGNPDIFNPPANSTDLDASLLAESKINSSIVPPIFLVSDTTIGHDGISDSTHIFGGEIFNQNSTSSQIGIGQVNHVQINPHQIGFSEISSTQVSRPKISTPKISTSEISSSQISSTKIGTNKIGPTEIATRQVGFRHIDTLQHPTAQISITQNDSLESIISRSITPEQFLNRNYSNGIVFDSAIGHSGIAKERSALLPSSISQISPSQIGIGKVGIAQNGITENGITQISPSQVSPTQFNVSQISSTQVGITQIETSHSSFEKIGITQIDPAQISVSQISSFKFDPSKVSFPSSVEFEQFFTSHNSSPQIINELNNSATNIWSNLLQPPTQLDIDFQITDLPTGQLAEATITGFDEQGLPVATRNDKRFDPQ